MKPRTKKDRSWANEPDSHMLVASTSSAPPLHDTALSNSSTTSSRQKQKQAAKAEPEIAPADPTDETISDFEWMRRRMATSALDVAPDASILDVPASQDQSASDSPDATTPYQTAPDGESTEELLKESPRLYLRNLAYSCTTSDLDEVFAAFGQIVQVRIYFTVMRPLRAKVIFRRTSHWIQQHKPPKEWATLRSRPPTLQLPPSERCIEARFKGEYYMLCQLSVDGRNQSLTSKCL